MSKKIGGSNVRIHDKAYDKFRWIAYKEHAQITDIIDEAAEMILKQRGYKDPEDVD